MIVAAFRKSARGQAEGTQHLVSYCEQNHVDVTSQFPQAMAPCDPRFVVGITIQFVCTGNVYRSRLAEAYCVSKCAPGVRVMSSGIGAGLNGDAPISPYAASVLARYGLEHYAAARWQPTTAALVQASDVIVFMEDEHLRFCEKWLDPERQRIAVWEIEDVGPMDVAEIPNEVERTFRIIRQRTDELLTALNLGKAEP